MPALDHSLHRIPCLYQIIILTLTWATHPFVAVAADPPSEPNYPIDPASIFQPAVPQGKVTKHSWTSKIFPGTVRDYWIYVPAQYAADHPACLMVFQDGGGYVTTNGPWRVPIVFDNLIAAKEMPVTIGLFVNPGVVPAPNSNALPRYNRSFEYDGLGDRYARFLLEELIPELSKTYRLSTDPNDRAIAGASSGAICAWTVAWERPDAFRRVFSTIGTYVGLRGGNDYPVLIRKSEPRPIRIFLQDGSNDNNGYGGSWWVANQDMLAALEFAGYDVQHEWGVGAHNGKHGGAILPKALRWLWRDYPSPIQKPENTKQPISEVLIPGKEWEEVASGFKFTEGPAANAKGEVFFTDIPNDRIHKLALDGKLSVFAEGCSRINGLMFGPDGRLFGCEAGTKSVVAFAMDGSKTTIAGGIEGNDIAISKQGMMYVTEPSAKKVWLVKADGAKQVVDEGIARPNGVLLSPDQSLLMVADTEGQFVFSFQIQSDGLLAQKQPFHHLHLPDATSGSGADGMTVDTMGRLYVATKLGLQFCDQAGRVNGIILKPQPQWLSNAVFGGHDFSYLYVTCGDKIYRRNTKAKGVLSFIEPIRPPAPRL